MAIVSSRLGAVGSALVADGTTYGLIPLGVYLRVQPEEKISKIKLCRAYNSATIAANILHS